MAWIDSICAFFIFLIGVLGGGYFFYGVAAYWAFNAYNSQQMAWLKEEDDERAAAGAAGEGSDDSGEGGS